MRKYIVAALAAFAATAVVAVAVAQTPPTHALSANITPDDAGTKTRPKPVTYSFNIVNSDKSTTADKVILFFPRELQVNTNGFKFCPASKINNAKTDQGVCPSGSKIGSGKAKARVGQSPKNFDVTVYVGSKTSIAIWLVQTDPGGQIRTAFEGKFSTATGNFTKKITIVIPKTVYEAVPGLFSSLDQISAKITGKTRYQGRTLGFLNSVGCSTKGQYILGSQLTYIPNPNPPARTSSSAKDTAECSR